MMNEQLQIGQFFGPSLSILEQVSCDFGVSGACMRNIKEKTLAVHHGID
jgi:hypothetical protein